MRQSWFSSLSPIAGSLAAAVLALLMTTANAPAQSRNDSNRDDSTAGDRTSSRDNQASNNDRSDQSGRSSRQSQSARGSQTGRPVSHPLLGVTFYNDESAPLQIRRVVPDSPAEEAGMERGDEILSVDGRRVASVQQLRQEIDRIGTDEDIEFGVLRDGREQTVTTRLNPNLRMSSSNRGRNQQQWSDQQYGGYNQGRGQQQWGGYNQGYGQSSRNSDYDRGYWEGYAHAQQEFGRQSYSNQRYGNQGYGGQTYQRGSRGADNWQGDQSQSSNRYAEGYRGSSGASDRAFLGIALDQSSRNGVRVNNVYPNSPAQQAGLRPGDEILAIDDDDVRSGQDVMRILSQRDPDDNVAIEVDRNGRQRTLHATLMSQQDFMASNNRGSYRTGRRDGYGQSYDEQGNDNRGNRRSQQDQNQSDESDNY